MRRVMASAWSSSSARWSATPDSRVCTSAPPRSSARDVLAGRRLHQRRAAQKDRRLVAHHDGLVGHGRHIGAARRARSHHAGDLRDAGRRHGRLVEEDAAEMLAVGKHLVLVGQVGAAGIDEIDAGQMVLQRDLLRAQMLLHRHRIIGAALHRGVVDDDHHLAALDAPDAGDQPGAGNRLVIEPMRRELADLEKRRAGVEQRRQPLPRQAACRARHAAPAAASGPPFAISAAVSDICATSARILSALARNVSEAGEMSDWMTGMAAD